MATLSVTDAGGGGPAATRLLGRDANSLVTIGLTAPAVYGDYSAMTWALYGPSNHPAGLALNEGLSLLVDHTFTPEVAGRYVVVVTATETLGAVVRLAAVYEVASAYGTEAVPSPLEELEYDGTTGWSRGVETRFKELEKLLGGRTAVRVLNGGAGALDAGEAAALGALSVFSAALSGTDESADFVGDVLYTADNYAATNADSETRVYCTPIESIGIGATGLALLKGVLPFTTTGRAVGDNVYVDDSSNLSFSVGTNVRRLGKVLTVGASTISATIGSIQFDGYTPTLSDDIMDALEGAATPSSSNVFATGTAVTAATPAASATVSGLVELATSAETITGTDTVRATTPAGVAAAIAAGSGGIVGWDWLEAAGASAVPDVADWKDISVAHNGTQALAAAPDMVLGNKAIRINPTDTSATGPGQGIVIDAPAGDFAYAFRLGFAIDDYAILDTSPGSQLSMYATFVGSNAVDDVHNQPWVGAGVRFSGTDWEQSNMEGVWYTGTAATSFDTSSGSQTTTWQRSTVFDVWIRRAGSIIDSFVAPKGHLPLWAMGMEFAGAGAVSPRVNTTPTPADGATTAGLFVIRVVNNTATLTPRVLLFGFASVTDVPGFE
jgi:hypothetical protein